MREMVEKDKDYMNLVADIIDHKEFVKTQNFVHHLSNRYEHSLRVSYISYKITKALRLDYESVARGGLLHDFFFTEEKKNKKESVSSLFMHSNYALINSRQHFELNEVEENIIAAHMFPFSMRVPLYLESWIVDGVDDVVAIVEVVKARKLQFQTAFNLLVLILLNTLAK